MLSRRRLPRLLRWSEQKILSPARMSSSSFDYCADLVRRKDYEHFLTSLLLPNLIRQAGVALRAFNVEISSVQDSVSEPHLGQMRMRFWTNLIEDIYANKRPPQHPVALQLHSAVKKYRLTKDLLLGVISSREELLTGQPFDTIEGVEEYGRNAFSSIYHLHLECLLSRSPGDGSEESLNGHARHAATQLGQAEAIVALIKGVAINVRRRQVYLPSDLMAAHGVSSEAVVRRTEDAQDGLCNVVESLAARAQEHLDSCRFRSKYLTDDTKLLMLPAVSVDAFLHGLHKAKCDPFDQSLFRRNSWLPVRLYVMKLRRTF